MIKTNHGADPDGPGPDLNDAGPTGRRSGDDDGTSPPDAEAFDRQIKNMEWRLDGLRPDPDSPQAAAFEALETTMEELRVAVEQLRQSNDALRDSRAEVEAERRRYRDLFDLSPDAHIVTDLGGVVREANRATSALLNIDPSFLPGKPLAVFVPEDGRSAFRSELPRLRDLAAVAEYDLRFQPRRLAPFDAAVRVGAVHDASGRPVGLRWTLRDISPRKRAEEKIRGLNDQLERLVAERSEQLESALQTNESWLIRAHAADSASHADGRLFHDLVQEVDAILWRADAATGRFTFVSRRAEELLGYPVARWLDDPGFWPDRVHPEDRDWLAAYRRKHLRDGRDHEAEYRVVAADGHAVWFRESVRFLEAGPGRPGVLCGLMVNISKRKKVERQLYTAKGELAERLRDMTYLHELGGRLVAARDPASATDEVLAAVTSLLGAEMAVVLLLDRDGRREGGAATAVVASSGLPAGFADRVGRGPRTPGGLGALLASREPFAVEDVEAEPELAGCRDDARAGGFRGLFGVPLFTRDGEPLGTIAAFFRTPHRPPERQARLVEMYAEQAADAIENARLLGLVDAAGRRRGRDLALVAGELKGPLDAILAAAHRLAPAAGRDAIERHALVMAGLVDRLAVAPAAEWDGTGRAIS